MIELVNSAYQPNVKLVNWICGRPRSMVMSRWLNVLSGIDRLNQKRVILYFVIAPYFHNCKLVLSNWYARIFPFCDMKEKKSSPIGLSWRCSQEVSFIVLIADLNQYIDCHFREEITMTSTNVYHCDLSAGIYITWNKSASTR